MGGNNMLSNQQPGNQMNQGGYHGGNQLGVNNMGECVDTYWLTCIMAYNVLNTHLIKKLCV